MEEKTRKVLFHLINTKTKGVDIYHHDGSMWLIFTNEKRWVIELTKKGTLWYNFDFFQNCFKYLSLDVVENQHYITEWVEDTIQNGVINTWRRRFTRHCLVEDTIQNGVRKIEGEPHDYPHTVANIIKNGVKHTEYGDWEDGDERLDDIIKNGVKQTCAQIPSIDAVVERVVEEGIKETNMEEHHRLREVVQTVKNGVKETHDDVYPHTARIEGVIKNGIKEVQPLPAQDGNRDWGIYYYRKEDITKPHTQYVNDVIENGEKF